MDDADSSNGCGIGIRGVAMAIDAVVWFALMFVAVYVVAAPTGQLETTSEGLNADLQGGAATLAFALWLGLSVGYHTLLEWQFGKTVGKALVQIRVTGDDGSPPSLRASFVRNISRLVDWLPAFYGVGIVALLVSDRHKRLGDRLGHTVVVRS